MLHYPCIPSNNRHVIRNIVDQQDKLKPAFNKAVDELIEHILLLVRPKKAIDGISLVNGCKFAALACEYVSAINTPGAIPDLEQGWQAVVRLELKKYSDKLLVQYKGEMEKALKDNLPMEETNLLQIHKGILKRSKTALEKKIYSVSPVGSRVEVLEVMLSQLKQSIIESSGEDENQVVCGIIFQFVTQNYSKSKIFCESLFRDLLKYSNIRGKVDQTVQTSKPLSLDDDVEFITSVIRGELLDQLPCKYSQMSYQNLTSSKTLLR